MSAVTNSGPLVVLAKVNQESREDIWIHPDLCRRVRREVLGE